MCGIVAATTHRDVREILMSGLRTLEYRGYDSAGIALQRDGTVERLRAAGKVRDLEALLEGHPLSGKCGIAHTRWATHGVPNTANAHPHLSGSSVALVHNGIIENHEELRDELQAAGYEFGSDTDTEVIAHRIHFNLQAAGDFIGAVRMTVAELEGAYALAVMSTNHPEQLVIARQGAPAVVGIGIGENFVASDVAALLPVTRRFVFLEEGDLARHLLGEVLLGGQEAVDDLAAAKDLGCNDKSGWHGITEVFQLNHIDTLVTQLNDAGHPVVGGINRSHRIFRIIEQQFV